MYRPKPNARRSNDDLQNVTHVMPGPVLRAPSDNEVVSCTEHLTQLGSAILPCRLSELSALVLPDI